MDLARKMLTFSGLSSILKHTPFDAILFIQPPHEIIVKFSGRLPLRFSNISDMLIFPRR
jgi:hypothetical protein